MEKTPPAPQPSCNGDANRTKDIKEGEQSPAPHSDCVGEAESGWNPQERLELL